MSRGERPFNPCRKGILYVAATPIGNMKDITLRAMDVLKSVSLVAAEDTRRTGLLLKNLGVKVRCISCREHNENQAAGSIIKILKAGDDVAFVTDAGTPGISDPAGRLVKRVREAGLRAEPVPGPSAAAAAMSVSGFTASSFYFAGFLPPKTGAREKALQSIRSINVPLIFFESPHRVVQVIGDMITILGDREVFMGREITKLHETHFSGLLSELEGELAGKDIKGEITLVVQGADAGHDHTNDHMAGVEKLVKKMVDNCAVSARDISELVSNATGIRKGIVYEMVNAMKKEG